MYARGVQEAEVQLVELRHDERDQLALSVVALGASLAATALYPPLVVPLFLGGVAVGSLGIRAIWRHWDLVDRLSDDRDAYTIAEVREYAGRDARIERRLRYAGLVRSWARTPEPAIAEIADELEGLACDLEDEGLEVDPAAAIECRRLLTDPTVSPLFHVGGTDELRSRIARIRAGFTPRART